MVNANTFAFMSMCSVRRSETRDFSTPPLDHTFCACNGRGGGPSHHMPLFRKVEAIEEPTATLEAEKHAVVVSVLIPQHGMSPYIVSILNFFSWWARYFSTWLTLGRERAQQNSAVHILIKYCWVHMQTLHTHTLPPHGVPVHGR